MKKILNNSYIFLLVALSLAACKKDDDPATPETQTSPTDGLEFIFTTDIPNTGLSVSFYADEALFTGYNNVYAQINETGSANALVTDADLSIMPMMQMPSMMHSCPFGNMSYDGELKLYKGFIVFIMGTMADGSWSLDVNVTNAEGETGEQTVDIEVVNPAESKVVSFVSDVDQASYFITLVEPISPEIGINDFVVGIYKRENMMSFPATSDLHVTIEPEMPSMGHGSPNNVNPAFTEDGMYSGKVNFTMSGEWKINMEVMDENMNLMKTGISFDITL